MKINLTPAEDQALEAMRIGDYLMIKNGIEGVSKNKSSINTIIRAGTIKRLSDAGLIEPTQFKPHVYHLTEKGILYAKFKK